MPNRNALAFLRRCVIAFPPLRGPGMTADAALYPSKFRIVRMKTRVPMPMRSSGKS